MAELVEFTINGKKVQAEAKSSLLNTIINQGFEIPHLCHHEAVKPYGACRLCLVEVVAWGRKRLTTACDYPIQAGLEVLLDTEKVQRNRKLVLELILAECPESEVIQELARKYGVLKTRFDKEDNDCIRCGLCERVCNEIVEVHAITRAGRGDKKKYMIPYDEKSEKCIGCGACYYVCPVHCIKLEQLPTLKRIDRWDRDLPMKKCKICGSPYAPTFQLMYFAKIANLPMEFFDKCPDCR